MNNSVSILIREPSHVKGSLKPSPGEFGACTADKRVGLSVGEGGPESPNRFFFYPILWADVWETAHFSAPFSESNRSPWLRSGGGIVFTCN